MFWANAHPVPLLCNASVCSGQLIFGAHQILLIQVELFLNLSKTRLRLPAAFFFQLQLLLQPRNTYTQPWDTKFWGRKREINILFKSLSKSWHSGDILGKHCRKSKTKTKKPKHYLHYTHLFYNGHYSYTHIPLNTLLSTSLRHIYSLLSLGH